MEDIRSYINAQEKTYTYRIKTVVPVTDAFMDRLERFLQRYKLVNISLPKKTIFQKKPLDFENIKNSEVYIIDIEIGLPASSFFMLTELAEYMSIEPKFFVIRGANDPVATQSSKVEEDDEMDAEAAKKGLKKASLLASGKYEEVPEVDSKDYYGQEYNSNFVGELLKIERAKREARIVVTPHPLGSWKAQKPEMDNGKFNDDIEGAPSVNPSSKKIKNATSAEGNVESAKTINTKVYTDKDGKTVILNRKTDTGKK